MAVSELAHDESLRLRPPAPRSRAPGQAGPSLQPPTGRGPGLPPANGLPSEARAANFVGISATAPDTVARAKMSLGLQQRIGNARIAALIVAPPRPATPVRTETAIAPPPTPASAPAAPPAAGSVGPPAAQPTPGPPASATKSAPAAAPTPAQSVPAAQPPAAASVVPPAAQPTPAPPASATTPAPAAAPTPAQPGPAAQPAAAPPGHARNAAGRTGRRAGETAAAAEPESADGAPPAHAVRSRAHAARPVHAGGNVAGHLGEAEGPSAGGPAASGRKAGGRSDVVLKMKEPPADMSPASHRRIAAAQIAAGHAASAAAALPSAAAHVDQARAAVTPPSAEDDAKAAADLVAALGERPKPSPEVEELCKQIYAIITSKTPDDEASIVATDPEKMAADAGDQLKGSVQGDVNKVGQNYTPLDQKPAGAPAQPGQPIADPGAAPPTPPIDAASAAPDPIPPEDASLDADAADAKAQTADAGMDTEPAKLAKSGPVADAREAQGELEQTAKEDPAKIVAQQQATLAKASADMGALQQSAIAALSAARQSATTHTGAQQHGMVGSETSMREQAGQQAQAIFDDTQTKVKALLQPLPQTAMQKWDAGVAISSRKFKDALKQVEDWIKERHSGVGGGVVGLWDDLTGLPSWVTDRYNEAERAFGDEICDLARGISTDVNGVIMACEALIADARSRINDIFAKLPTSLQTWAAGEQAKFGQQLDGLAQQAHQVQANFTKDLVNTAARTFQDARDQLHALREKAKGLIGQIKDAIQAFLKDPAKFIINALLELLSIPPAAFWAVVAKIQKVVKDIADDPLKFATNLLAGIGKGFSQFFDHILPHLLHGFIDWLTGGLASAGVTLPKDASVKSIVTFILQLMGITWPRIRKLLAKHIGEENVALIEKAYSIVANLIALGPEGVFEMIKQKLDPATIMQQVIKAAVDYMIKAVVEAVAARIILLFNPVGAVLEAIEAIYRVLKWIFVNAARIFRLVETVVNTIADIMAGNIGGVANMVEAALAQLIPPVIDFLADYLGFGDLPDKVKDTILALQAWVESILDEVIGWLVAKGKELLKAIGIGGEDDKDKDKGDKYDGKVGKEITWTVNKEPHKLWIAVEGGAATVNMASESGPVFAALEVYDAKATELKEEDPDAAAEIEALIPQARELATDLNASASELASEVAKPQQAEQPDPKKEEAEESEIEAKENALRGLISEIQTKLGLNDDEQIKKAREAFGNRLFSTGDDLVPLLEISLRTAQRRISKWIATGIVFRLESEKTDPLGLCSFDPIKAGQRETDPNNRYKYGYVNPKKDSPTGLIILTKGIRLDSKDFSPGKTTIAEYHKIYARYDSKRGARNFPYEDAVLGHKLDEGASDHWKRVGHTQDRAANMAWNQDPDNYDGPEHYIESAASGPGAERYIIPSKHIGSNTEWL
jgi:hypothetical protein